MGERRILQFTANLDQLYTDRKEAKIWSQTFYASTKKSFELEGELFLRIFWLLNSTLTFDTRLTPTIYLDAAEHF